MFSAPTPCYANSTRVLPAYLQLASHYQPISFPSSLHLQKTTPITATV